MDVAFEGQEYQVVGGCDKHVPHEPFVGPEFTSEEAQDTHVAGRVVLARAVSHHRGRGDAVNQTLINDENVRLLRPLFSRGTHDQDDNQVTQNAAAPDTHVQNRIYGSEFLNVYN